MFSSLLGWFFQGPERENQRVSIQIDIHRKSLLKVLKKENDIEFCIWFKSKTDQYVIEKSNAKEQEKLTQLLYHFTKQIAEHVQSENYSNFVFDESQAKKTKLIRRVLSSNMNSIELTESDDDRVFRYYGCNRFIRVDFDMSYGEEEKCVALLKEGFKLHGVKYLPLGASSSLLSSKGVYFTDGSDPQKMMDDFGSYDSSCMAHRIARQCLNFTSSTETIVINKYIVVDDVYSKDKKGKNSDGIGMISYSAAKQVCVHRKEANGDGRFVPVPRAFQIRHLGFKGMLTVVPDRVMKGNQIIFRHSMKKFEGNPKFNKLEIVEDVNEAGMADINRQIIILLSYLQIEDSVFLEAQRTALSRMNCKQEDEYRARLENAVGKTKFRIKDSAIVRGLLDETGQLKNDEVIVFSKTGKMVPEGKVIVFRNPGHHPGDVKILKCVNIQDYDKKWFKDERIKLRGSAIIFAANTEHHMIPGDLDGDMYFVSWNKDIIPKSKYLESWWETLKNFSLEEFILDGFWKFTSDTVHSFHKKNWTPSDVFWFRMNSNIGVMSNKWVAVCDKEGAGSKRAKQLASLISEVMESSKNGKLVELPSWANAYEKPTYMEGGTRVSTSIIGKLYNQALEIKNNYELNNAVF